MKPCSSPRSSLTYHSTRSPCRYSIRFPAAVAWLTEKGMRFTPGGIRKGAAGYDVCFIHPKGSADAPVGGEGVLIELVQAPAEVIEAFRRLAAVG